MEQSQVKKLQTTFQKMSIDDGNVQMYLEAGWWLCSSVTSVLSPHRISNKLFWIVLLTTCNFCAVCHCKRQAELAFSVLSGSSYVGILPINLDTARLNAVIHPELKLSPFRCLKRIFLNMLLPVVTANSDWFSWTVGIPIVNTGTVFWSYTDTSAI